MTISTLTCKAYGLGNGATTDFDFTFVCPETSVITVYFVDTDQTITDVTSSCVVTLNAVGAGELWPIGGSVHYEPGGNPIATDTYVVIVRELPETQETEFENQDAVYNQVTEMTFDEVVMLVQQLQEAINRCVLIPIQDVDGYTVTLPMGPDRVSSNLIVDSDGNITTGTTVSGATVSSAMIPVVEASTTAAALALLGGIGDPTTTEGDLIYRHTGALARLGVGAANRFLTSDGTDPEWTTLTARLDAIFSSTQGAILYRDAAAWAALAPGTAGQTLVSGGAAANPSWGTASSGSPALTPQGRLTLVSATPVMTTTQSAKTSVFYTPYNGYYVPIYDGSMWTNTSFAELTLALDSNAGHTGYQQSGKLFDLFVINNSGTVTLVSGPAWSSSTARGSGAGTTELVRVNGLLLNANQITTKFDATASTITLSAQRGTYVGTTLASADGQTQWIYGALAAGGTAAGFNLWNCYNRVSVSTFVQDSTNSWTYNSLTWRAPNGSATMRAAFIQGLAEDAFEASYKCYSSNTLNNANQRRFIGLGYDATNALAAGCSPGRVDAANMMGGDGLNPVTPVFEMNAKFVKSADLGSHFLSAIEAADVTNSTTFLGDDGAPTLTQSGLFFSGRF